MPSPRFENGNPGGPGRKPAKMKKWRQVDTWGEIIMAEFPNLRASDKVDKAIRMLELILKYKALSPNTVPEILKEVEAIYNKQLGEFDRPIPPVLAIENKNA